MAIGFLRLFGVDPRPLGLRHFIEAFAGICLSVLRQSNGLLGVFAKSQVHRIVRSMRLD